MSNNNDQYPNLNDIDKYSKGHDEATAIGDEIPPEHRAAYLDMLTAKRSSLDEQSATPDQVPDTAGSNTSHRLLEELGRPDGEIITQASAASIGNTALSQEIIQAQENQRN